MDPAGEQAASEQTNGTSNGKEEPVVDQTVAVEGDETVVETVAKSKVLNVAPSEEVPENFSEYLSDSTTTAEEGGDKAPVETAAVPTSVIQSVPKPDSEKEEETENLEEKKESDKELDLEPAAEAPPADLLEEEAPKEASCTVADLIEEEEEENSKEEPEKEVEAPVEEEEEKKEEEVAEEKVEEESEEKVEEQPEEKVEENGEEDIEMKEEEKKEETKVEEKEKEEDSEEKKAEARSQKSETKTAAELAYEWDDEGVEEEKVTKKDEKKKSSPKKSAAVLKAEAEVTPGRKSSRTPKPTQRKLESESQKNLKDPEEEEGSGDGEEDEESVDAIAKELEKSEDSKKSPSKGKASPKKGKKPVSEEKSKEEWVNLIFGENGEKVTDKGKKGGSDDKDDKKESKDKDEEGPEAEEFLPDDTPKSKKGGRPKKKGLDDKFEGVSKLGSNMYFYTGPGGNESPPPLDSDEEDLPIKKADSEPARKSSRANKGRNTRLERGDEVVDIPQVKEAPKPNLNPSWLKNHDSKKDSPAKKGSTPAAKSTPAASKKKEDKKEEKKEDQKEEDKLEEELEAMDTSEPVVETPKGRGAKKAAEKEKEKVVEDEEKEEETTEAESKEPSTPAPNDEELPEFDPDKFTPGYVPTSVKKGEHEYNIIVSGVKDTGLCGNYWNVSEGGRRRSKPPETLQMGKNERRGSVGSVNSEKSGKDSPAAAAVTSSKKPAVATPKSSKKQVTKPEKTEAVAEEDVKEEAKTPVSSGRGRKRKTDTEAPASDKKAKKEVVAPADDDDTKEFSDYDSGNNETQPLRKKPKKEEKKEDSKEAAGLTSKQQTAVAAALAAGVPGGQQRSVSCVADTNTQREVVVECFAPYDDHRWVNIGKERDGMAPDAVQYARALRPPYHLLSFLRIKGHSTKGMSCTDKNTMVFVVLEGEITVILHTTQFNAKKGDSFYIPPKNYYNLINQKAREAELSLIQFQYDGPLPTVQPSSS